MEGNVTLVSHIQWGKICFPLNLEVAQQTAVLSVIVLVSYHTITESLLRIVILLFNSIVAIFGKNIYMPSLSLALMRCML